MFLEESLLEFSEMFTGEPVHRTTHMTDANIQTDIHDSKNYSLRLGGSQNIYICKELDIDILIQLITFSILSIREKVKIKSLLELLQIWHIYHKRKPVKVSLNYNLSY